MDHYALEIGQRWNGKCRCGKFVSKQVVAVESDSSTFFSQDGDFVQTMLSTGIGTCSCGRNVRVNRVFGVVVEKVKCGARCMGSKSHTCDCSCGGKNHGKDG